jgi:filamentous hemagglutinin family protein
MKKIIYIFLFLIFTNAFSKPKNPKIISGDVSIKNNLIIDQKSNKAIVNWDDFSISENEIFNFNLPSNKASILNRVISKNPSEIFGKINSNGKVFLVNENGIIFSKTSSINAYKFIASTLNIENKDFLNSNILNLASQNDSSILNLGDINTENEIILIAPKVVNKGKIYSKKLCLLVGSNDLILNQENDKSFVKINKNSIGSVENLGMINALKTQIEAQNNNIYSFAINQDGIIDASSFIEENGEIYLSADEGISYIHGDIKAKDINLYSENILFDNALIDISLFDESTLSIGKKNNKLSKTISIDENTKILADSYTSNINKVTILSEDKTIFNGKILARGLGKDSSGCDVEISSKNKLISTGYIDLKGNFKNGNILFDPGSVHIQKGENFEIDSSNFNDAYINELLKTSNVEISTLNSNLNDTQTILIDSDVNISWEEDTTLKLTSNRDIIFKTGSIISNKSENNFLAIDIRTLKADGNFSSVVIEKDAVISTKAADINIDATSGNLNNNNIAIHLLGRIESINDENRSGNINLIGKVNRAESNNHAIFIDSGSIISKNANVNITALSEATQDLNHALYLDNNAKIHLDNSSLNIEAVGSGTNSSGIFIAKAQIKALNDSNIKISAKEAYSYGIYLSQDAYIISDANIELFSKNSIFSSAQIDCKKDISAYIGIENRGKFVLKKTIPSKISVYGGDFGDIFNIDCSQNCFIDGKSLKNTLIARDIDNTFIFDETNQGSVNNEIFFKNISNFIGSRFNDDKFIFLDNSKITGTIDGVYGSNSIKAPNIENTFFINSLNAGEILNVAKFKNIPNLIGNMQNDTFIFVNNSLITGVINGVGSENTVDYSRYTNPLTIDLHKIINVSKIIGGSSENTLLAPEAENSWRITNLNEGYINNIKFFNIENLIGSDQGDKFYFDLYGVITGYIDGNKGYNYLFSPNENNKWYITNENEGYIEDIVYFKNIHNLYGNEKNDTFTFVDSGKISGNIDGNSSVGNILDYSSFENQAYIDLNKVFNIQSIIGNEITTLIAKDVNNIFNITSKDSGKINDEIIFSSIKNIVGGSKDDRFEIGKDGFLSGFFDGADGINTIVYNSNEDALWNINSKDTGLINNLINFKNIQNLTGSENSDKFIFTNDGLISGNIVARGDNNILDFSNKITASTIDLNKIENISKIIGSNHLDLLVGKDSNNIWDITSINSGTVNNVEFYNIENLKGGALSDIFKFNDLSKISGMIDGGNDADFLNLIDYSMCTQTIEANILTNVATNTGSISNIQAVVLPNISLNPLTKKLDFIEIPLYQSEIAYNLNNDPILNKFKFENFDTSNPLLSLDEVGLSIYISERDNKTLVYKAYSNYVITKNQVRNKYSKISLTPFMSNLIIADDVTRMKNNLNVAIPSNKIANRGDLNKIDAVYDTDSDGFDLDNYKIVKSDQKDRVIKNKPRPLRFRAKKNKK